MKNCYKEVNINVCTELNTTINTYDFIVKTIKEITEIFNALKDNDLDKIYKAINEKNDKIKQIYTLSKNVLVEGTKKLIECEPTSKATESELKKYLEKTAAVINEYTMNLDCMEKKDPFFAIRTEYKGEYVAINERNKITSFNNKQKDIVLTKNDFLSKVGNTAIEEAPRNELAFIRTKNKWIPFFLIPYIATKVSQGLAKYATLLNNDEDLLVSPLLLASYLDKTILKQKDAPLKDGLYVYGVDLNGKNFWDSYIVPNPVTATIKEKGITSYHEILSAKNFKNEADKEKAKLVEDPFQSNVITVRNNGKWVALNSKITKVPDYNDYITRKVSNITTGYVRYIQGNYDKLNDTDVMRLENISQITGVPLLQIPKPLKKYEYYVVQQNNLKVLQKQLATTTNIGSAKFAQNTIKSNQTEAIKAEDAYNIINKLFQNKSAGYTNTDDKTYGLKNDTNKKGELVLTDISNITKASRKAQDLIKLEDAVTVKKLLELINNNIMPKKTNKLSAVKNSNITNIQSSDYVVFSELSKKSNRKKLLVDNISIIDMAVDTKNCDDVDEIFAIIEKTSIGENLNIYRITPEDHNNYVEKVASKSINLGADTDHVKINITKKIDYQGNVIKDKYVLFLTDSVKGILSISIYSVDIVNNTFTISAQLVSREYPSIKLHTKRKVVIDSFNQKNGGIELTVAIDNNIAIFQYNDLSQPNIHKKTNTLLYQKPLPFSNNLYNLLSYWIKKQTSTHFLYQYITNIRNINANFKILSILSLENEINVQLDVGIYITLVIKKDKNSISGFEVSSALAPINNNVILLATYFTKNKIIYALENKATKEKLLAFYDKNLKVITQDIPLGDFDATNILFIRNGISAIIYKNKQIVEQEIKKKNIDREFNWLITPNNTIENEGINKDLIFIY
jgi:hypothetical protein